MIGSPIRTMHKCVDIYLLVKRKKTYLTSFYLSEEEYLKARKVMKVKKNAGESEDDFNDRKHDEDLKQGRAFLVLRHGGLVPFEGLKVSDAPLPAERTSFFSLFCQCNLFLIKMLNNFLVQFY